MSILQFLTQTCEVYRISSSSKNEYGESLNTYSTFTYPCFMDYPKRGLDSDDNREFQGDGLLFIDKKNIINMNDVVSNIKDGEGNIIDGKKYLVKSVGILSDDYGIHHYECDLFIIND